MSNQLPDSISLAEGEAITTNWRDYITKIDKDPNYIRAFNIPMEDIVNLSKFSQCPSVRAYLAMGTKDTISTLKIILVPVDIKGNDIISMPGATAGDPADSTIFDFTSPCPQTCDINSPLFQP